MASLSSENPYATIRDLPGLPGGPRESSYMEMKGPPAGSLPRQPPQPRHGERRRQPQPQRDSGTYEQPSPLSPGEPPSCPGVGTRENGDTAGRREGQRRARGGGVMWQRARPWGPGSGSDQVWRLGVAVPLGPGSGGTYSPGLRIQPLTCGAGAQKSEE